MMTIQDFNEALTEQGSKIQQDFGTLRQAAIREVMDTSPEPDAGGWYQWAT